MTMEIRSGPSQNQVRYPKESYPVVWYVIVNGELVDQFATKELAQLFAKEYCGLGRA